MSQSQIQEVFGQFAVELADGAKLFPTHEEAAAALHEFEKGAEVRKEAADFCAFAKKTGKQAKTQSNVIAAYLAWVDLGRPEPVVVTEEEAIEADAVEADEAAVEVAGLDEEF